MTKIGRQISVFEHDSLYFKHTEADQALFASFKDYHGSKGVPYFKLLNNGIQFNEYVGVIQLGNTLVEVLPKADRLEKDNVKWRAILIDMLKTVHGFEVRSTSTSALKIKLNSILDLYFELFVKEVEQLIYRGLIKQYRKQEGNTTSLKGGLVFPKHIQQNLIHQERFYVCYTVYNTDHLLHQILFKTIQLIRSLNTNSALQSRIYNLLLNFPELYDLKVSESLFDKIVFTRKNKAYIKSIEIARMLLLKYHPDLKSGRNNTLALMFDMNLLWEQFVFISLSRQRKMAKHVVAQFSKNFWKPEKGYTSRVKPDIVVDLGTPNCVVLDTKWKNLNGYNPSPDDLRQMYVYHEYYGAKKVALIYPGVQSSTQKGNYYLPNSHHQQISDKECAILNIGVGKNVRIWQEEISQMIEDWVIGEK